MSDNPFAKLGALDQKLYQQPSPEPERVKPHPADRATAKARPNSAEAPKREIKPRHPFDVYQDQLDRLKDLSLKAKMRGEKGSQSAMVREALDNYLKDKKD